MERTTRILLLGFLVVLVAAHGFWRPMWPWSTHAHWFGGGWNWLGIGGLSAVAFWGAVVVGLFILAHGSGVERRDSPDLSPTDILKRRYAKGEITRQRYEEMSRTKREAAVPDITSVTWAGRTDGLNASRPFP